MLSVVIPTWSGTDELARMAYKLCEQVRPMCDVLIVSEDGEYYAPLKKIADVYLMHPRLGHAKNLKLGFQYAAGVEKCWGALIDSGIISEKGDLRDLCIPNTIVYPEWNEESWKQYTPPQKYREPIAWFLVAPYEIIASFPPHPSAAYGLGEGLDEWGEELVKRFPILWSDKLTYSHQALTSYGVILKK